MARLLLYLFLWIGSMGLVIFTGQNTVLVTIKLASLESIKLPLGLVLTFCTGLGAIAVTLLQTSFRLSLPTAASIPLKLDKLNFFTSQKTFKPIKNNSINEKQQRQSNAKQKTGDDFDDDWDDDWN